MKRTITALAGTAAAGLAMLAAPPLHAQYRQKIGHSPAKCAGGDPAVWVTINGVSASRGTIRVQSYRATAQDWLESGRWINRIEIPAKAGQMTVCMPVPGPGRYGIAVRHDVNGNGKTDLSADGGAMSNNPSINIFNLGKPSYRKVGVDVGSGVKSITVTMRYM
ncbi:DUF2141 domain-containing protein [Qipengyuania sp. MTN3-11]|uniref:DUF2141 domain-containing protein n=1 Tax=Qipengyuania sp. MTN3-11 TaxID=3056557 RepID=UPI0036F267CF